MVPAREEKCISQEAKRMFEGEIQTSTDSVCKYAQVNLEPQLRLHI